MTTGRLRTGAAAAALVAALIAAATYLHGVVFITEPFGDTERWAAWMGLPQLLFVVALVAVPTVGAVLLLDDRGGRRLLGGALVATYGLMSALLLPSYLLGFELPADTAFRVNMIGHLLSIVVAAGAGVLAATVLVAHPDVTWRDPRASSRPRLRLVALFAMGGLAVAYVAPTTTAGGETLDLWFGGMLSGGFSPTMFLQGALSWLVPAAGLILAGLVVAWVRPAAVAVGVAASVAALEVVTVINTPLTNAISEAVWDQTVRLTVWYWLHVAATIALVVALVALYPTRERRVAGSVR